MKPRTTPAPIFLRPEAGFTLIELVITIVIMGFVATIMIPFIQSITHSPDPMIRQQAIALGQALMDEILAKRWDEKTPLGGGPIRSGESGIGVTRAGQVLDGADPLTAIATEEGSRTNYDDIDDYHGWSKTDTFMDQTMSAFTMTGFTREVTVDYIPSNSPTIDQNTAPAGGTTDTKRIIVKVISPLSETFYFVAVMCNI